MSRSYKKQPVFKSTRKQMKKFANKKVRQYKKEIGNGSGYKKLSCSWDICDFALRQSLKERKQDWESERKSYFNGYEEHCVYYTGENSWKDNNRNWRKIYYNK